MSEQHPEPAGMDRRVVPAYLAAERPMLESWLEYHRATLMVKCSGLSDEQLKTRSAEPSSLSLLGLVRHMTEVERNWFRRVMQADAAAGYLYATEDAEDGDFDLVDEADAATDLDTFRAELEVVRAIAAEHDSLDAIGANLRRGERVSLRWIYIHMIEEYARHNGHADLLRERIDGAADQ